MPLITLERVLKEDPVNSADFQTAIEALIHLVEVSNPSSEQDESLESFRAALGSRTWTDEEIRKFVERVDACTFVALLANRLDTNPESMNTGCLAKANLFAALHMKTCLVCKLFSVLEKTAPPAKSESSN